MKQEKEPIRFKEYMEKLQESRKKEVIREDIINEFNRKKGVGLTSPTTLTSTEETRLLMEYMDRSNIFHISKRDEKRGRILTFIRFFRSKRSQQVEVYSKSGKESLYTEGKVSAIGRDFVMLTNLKNRFWIPYTVIDSANIPYGIPNYSNTHQHYIYDNDLQHKLIHRFGETVGKRDVLKQQFYEETLQTNLSTWADTWVEVFLANGEKKIGKIIISKEGRLQLKRWSKQEAVQLNEVTYIQTIRFLRVFKNGLKSIAQFFKT